MQLRGWKAGEAGRVIPHAEASKASAAAVKTLTNKLAPPKQTKPVAAAAAKTAKDAKPKGIISSIFGRLL